jgi:diamine N-acetyltransferase
MTELADAPVTLREITRTTLHDILKLKVSPDQEQNVAPNAVSIAEAHFYPELAWFRAIYAGETPVGFLMLADDPAAGSYFLWRLMIDTGYQGRGYGRRALELLCDHVRTRPGATALETSVHPGPSGPGLFYEKLGFAYTGEINEGELVMRRAL